MKQIPNKKIGGNEIKFHKTQKSVPAGRYEIFAGRRWQLSQQRKEKNQRMQDESKSFSQATKEEIQFATGCEDRNTNYPQKDALEFMPEEEPSQKVCLFC